MIAAVLAAVAALTIFAAVFLKRTASGAAFASAGRSARASLTRVYTQSHVRIRLSRTPQRLLRRLLRCSCPIPALELLRSRCRDLSIAMLQAEAAIRRLPPLPADLQGRARMLNQCRQLLDRHATITVSAMTAMLRQPQSAPQTTLDEREAVPTLMQQAILEGLPHALHTLLQDAAAWRRGERLADRLIARKKPVRTLLRRRKPGRTETVAMLRRLREREAHEVLAAIETLMQESGTSASRLHEAYTHHQTALAQEIDGAIRNLRMLQRLDWTALSEEADPLHALFQGDSSGTYPRMDAQSRRTYRRAAAYLARLLRADEARVARCCVSLAHEAADDHPRNHIGYWLLTAQGAKAVRERLQSPYGAAALWLTARRQSAAALCAGVICVLCGWFCLTLDAGFRTAIPVALMLAAPIRSMCLRWLDRLLPAFPAPALAVEEAEAAIRTLIVLPAVLASPSDAIACVRQLAIARDACADGAAEFMLLGDYDRNATARSGMDADIVRAAKAAIEALDTPDVRFYYMQRQRAWDAQERCFRGQNGTAGLMTALNELAAYGQCGALFDMATVEPAQLHRRYDSILALAPEMRILPDRLSRAIGILEHPLNRRWQTADGFEGSGMLLLRTAADPDAGDTRFSTLSAPREAASAVLYRPDDLADVLSVAPSLPPDSAAAQMMCCAMETDGSCVLSRAASGAAQDMRNRWQRVYGLWRSLPWVVSRRRNTFHAAQHAACVRTACWASATPVLACLLLLPAVIMRQPLPFLLVLLPVLLWELEQGNRPVRMAYETVMLPMHAAIHFHAILHAIRDAMRELPDQRRAEATLPERRLVRMACWSQGLAATLCAVFALVTLPPVWTLFAAGAVFASFLWLPGWLDGHRKPAPVPDDETTPLLHDIAGATWQFFEAHVGAQTHFLPPARVQLHPPRGDEPYTTPDAIAMYLLATLTACDMRLITPETAAGRMSDTIASLARLETWKGLFFARYRTDTCAPMEPRCVESESNGLLCAALLVCAQGMRTQLASLNAELRALPAQMDELAARMRLSCLYDPEAGLFRARRMMQGDHSAEHLPMFASRALLLSFLAVMRGEAPAAHFIRLDRTLVRTNGRTVMLSPHGSAADYALAALLLPCVPGTPWGDTVRGAIELQQLHQKDGLFGFSDAASGDCDVHMRARTRQGGIPALAVHISSAGRAVAPYAAALCLPWLPRESAQCLARLQAMRMYGPHGFFDSLEIPIGGGDYSVVQVFDAAHQGIVLCAVGNALTQSPKRHFAMLPGAQAWETLLRRPMEQTMIVSPAAVRMQQNAEAQPEAVREANTLVLPPDAHLIGSEDASALTTGDGYTVMRGSGIPWTRFTGTTGVPEGLRIGVSDNRRSIRVGHGCKATYHEGCAVFRQTLGRMQLTLTVAVDPISAVVWHILDLTNLAASERTVTVYDLFLPDLPDDEACRTSVQTQHDGRMMTARMPNGDGTLCHAVTADTRFTVVQAATDCAKLNRAVHDALHAPHDASCCCSFECQLAVVGRSRATVAFATFCHHGDSPEEILLPPQKDQLLGLARMYSRIQHDHLSIGHDQAMRCMHMTGALLWHGMPHQGAASNLTVTTQQLCAMGVDTQLPMALLSLAGDDCLPILNDCIDALAILRARGYTACLVVICRGKDAESTREMVQTALASYPDAKTAGLPVSVFLSTGLPDGVREALESLARVILFSGYDLLSQLRATRTPLALYEGATGDTTTADMPEGLLFSSPTGGFHPQTHAYVLLAGTRTAETGAWRRMLADRRFGTRVSGFGLLSSYAGAMLEQPLTGGELPGEAFFIEADGARISPCLYPYGRGCKITVQHSAGATVWHAEGAELDVKLTAAVLPGYGAGIRTLRIRNRSAQARTIALYASASFTMGDTGALTWLTTIGSMAIASHPNSALNGYLASLDDGATVTVMSSGAFHATLGLYGSAAPAHGQDGIGCVALLRREMALEAGASGHATFLLGAARTMDETERAVEHVRTHGASSLIRSARQRFAQKTERIAVYTPDEALNLMMNHLLPAFLYTPHPEQDEIARVKAAAAFVPSGSHTMRTRLLSACAHIGRRDDEALLLPMLAAWYIRRTGDEGLLDAPIPITDATQEDRDSFAMHCMRILTDIRLNTDGLPAARHASPCTAGMMYVTALRAFRPYMPEASLHDAERMASLVTAAVERARSARPDCQQACWAVFAGLSDRLPEDCEPANLAETIPYLHALCITGEYAHAWTLVQWLNPVSHHDERTPPWQPEPNGRHMHAAWLYITILERLLGFDRRGQKLRFSPHLPEEWGESSIQLTVGAATWHAALSTAETEAMLDGEAVKDGSVTLTDDGRIHQLRFPADKA